MIVNINNPLTAAEVVVDSVTWKQLYCMSQGQERQDSERSSISGAGHCKNHVWCIKRDLSLLSGSPAGKFLLLCIKTCKQNSLWLHSLHSKNTSPRPLTRKLSEQGVTGGLYRCCPVSRDEKCFTSLVWSYFPCSSRLHAPEQVKPNLPFLPPHCMCTWKTFNRFSVCLTGAHVHAWAEMCIVTWTLSLAGWQVIKIKHIHISYV